VVCSLELDLAGFCQPFCWPVCSEHIILYKLHVVYYSGL
jgi:hypothetical protein